MRSVLAASVLSLVLMACGSGGSSSEEFSAERSGIIIPLRITEDRVYVNLEINGVTVECLLDTGASAIFISTKIAESVGAPLTYSVDHHRLFRYESVRLGPWEWLDTEFWGHDAWWDCLVGLEPFEGGLMTIDFERQELIIEEGI